VADSVGNLSTRAVVRNQLKLGKKLTADRSHHSHCVACKRAGLAGRLTIATDRVRSLDSFLKLLGDFGFDRQWFTMTSAGIQLHTALGDDNHSRPQLPGLATTAAIWQQQRQSNLRPTGLQWASPSSTSIDKADDDVDEADESVPSELRSESDSKDREEVTDDQYVGESDSDSDYEDVEMKQNSRSSSSSSSSSSSISGGESKRQRPVRTAALKSKLPSCRFCGGEKSAQAADHACGHGAHGANLDPGDQPEDSVQPQSRKKRKRESSSSAATDS
jgi:hypothetical protein